FTAADLSTEALPDHPGTANSLKIKEFSVPTAPEVGRIIERSAGASRTYFNFVSAGAFWLLATSCKLQVKAAAPLSTCSLQLAASRC
ncbi:hypothetical protein, partial [Pseudomonas sp. 2(2015)]|uniref:hypothetical protein n=1 Tax=Pseudomonas sp. 2(2015) TaxID=1619950 RepID=UPI0023B97C00